MMNMMIVSPQLHGLKLQLGFLLLFHIKVFQLLIQYQILKNIKFYCEKKFIFKIHNNLFYV